MKTLRIDIIADIVCPWSEIGYRRLTSAIASLNEKVNIDINWQPYELNPTLPDKGANLYQHTKKQYHLSDTELTSVTNKVKQWAEEVGFDIAFDHNFMLFNSRKAHQLMMWSTLARNTETLRTKLVEAYFSDNLDINNDDVLKSLCRSMNVNDAVVDCIVSDKTWEQAVILTEKQWLDAGINKTPTVILEQNKVISGVRSEEEYQKILQELLPELKHIH
ncbi:DsbA family protein [Vibrio sp.]|uniref:DsbA family protein n=1 Tax=Vibrio viridaestus TaxID=2487322 RepID=A0A3N9U5X3_9VIBR|nr:DsbA family protein [Vibrio viridaestus]MDC0610562.1 DsbA family protein [Vibrio sp.]RQW65132.1 DsbA family protein [Vibrio viridaestus]